MSQDFETVEVEEIPNISNGLQVYQQDKAFLDMQIATAKRYPRNLKKVISNAITIVTMDLEIAETCTYSLKKGKTISGPSVNLARILARQMTNIRVDNKVVGYDATHVTCEATCFDLENNYAVRTTLKRSIMGKDGRYSEDMATITGNAGNAVAFRNAVFAVVGAEIVNTVYKAALKTITGDLSSEDVLVAKVTSMVKFFKESYESLNLTDDEIAASVGRKTIGHITKEDVAILIGFEKSIKDSEVTPESIFRPQSGFLTVYNKTKYVDKSAERMLDMIKNAKTRKDLEKLNKDITTNEARIAYDIAYQNLK